MSNGKNLTQLPQPNIAWSQIKSTCSEETSGYQCEENNNVSYTSNPGTLEDFDDAFIEEQRRILRSIQGARDPSSRSIAVIKQLSEEDVLSSAPQENGRHQQASYDPETELLSIKIKSKCEQNMIPKQQPDLERDKSLSVLIKVRSAWDPLANPGTKKISINRRNISRDDPISHNAPISESRTSSSKITDQTPERKQIEVYPGHALPLCGHFETKTAFDKGKHISSAQCLHCNINLKCLDYVSMIVCPQCMEISTHMNKVGNGQDLVGLGTLM